MWRKKTQKPTEVGCERVPSHMRPPYRIVSEGELGYGKVGMEVSTVLPFPLSQPMEIQYTDKI